VTGAGIGAALYPLYNKEPIGTIMQVANYSRDLVGQFDANPSGVVLASGGGPQAGGVWSSFTLAAANAAVVSYLDTMADVLDSFSILGMSALAFIRLGIDLGALFLVIRSVFNSVKVVA
jgi:hypothetical protein